VQFLQFRRILRSYIVRLRPVARGIELPNVVLDFRELSSQQPWRAVPGTSRPPLVVDAAIDEHLEILRRVPIRRLRVIERIGNARAFDRLLLNAIDKRRRWYLRRLKNGRHHIDHMAKLIAQFALRFDAGGPANDHAVACAAPMGSHLLCPLVRRVHRMRPSDRVVGTSSGHRSRRDVARSVRWSAQCRSGPQAH
jgi:hypothetical protein